MKSLILLVDAPFFTVLAKVILGLRVARDREEEGCVLFVSKAVCKL